MHGSEVHLTEKLERNPDKLTGEYNFADVIIFLVAVSGVTPYQIILKDLRSFVLCGGLWML